LCSAKTWHFHQPFVKQTKEIKVADDEISKRRWIWHSLASSVSHLVNNQKDSVINGIVIMQPEFATDLVARSPLTATRWESP
jgi:hypothetical protein